MSKVLFRLSFFGLPALVATCAIVGACSSDDTTGAETPDAAPDVTTQDASIPDANMQPDVKDAGQVDSSVDAAEAAPPPLCQLNPNTAADASTAEGPRRLYELIALRALLDAAASCEIGAVFPDLEDPPPSQITCFGKQLASLSGCLVGGAPIDYKVQLDENGVACVPALGEVVQLGFRNPAMGSYTARDVDFLITLVRKAALSTGMSAADADRLKALLEAKKPGVAGDAGDGGNFSQSTCP